MSGRAPRITAITRYPIRLPFRERCAPWNDLLVGSWELIELIHIETEDSELSGWGESVVSYTSRTVADEAIARLIGENPADHLWDSSVGMGLQMALFDVVARGQDVPVARLLNLPPVRTSAPIAWWNTKMPPKVLAAEAEDAVAEGYLAHKFKARPWFDVVQQIEEVSAVTPQTYQLDIDFNRMLLDRATALPLLRRLDGYRRVGLYEAPIAEGMFDDYRVLREQLHRPIVEHFDQGPFRNSALARCYDGYVFSPNTLVGGVGSLLQQGILAQEFGKSGWIQMIGTGLTTAFVLQVTSVLPAARWPFVTGMNGYVDDLVTEPITIAGGQAHLPHGPGLGVDVDREAIERFSVSADYRRPTTRRILTLTLPGDRRRDYGSMQQLWQDCRVHGNVPLTGEGAYLEIREDDGTEEFAGRYRRLQEAPQWQV